MRLIHSSDWHLGQLFYGKTREQEQKQFLDWLVEQVQEYQVDAVVVAGDLFDTGTPPSYARSLYNRFINKLTQTGCQLILLAGNHDSVAVLNESRELLERLNANIVAGAEDELAHRIIPLNNRQGIPAAVLCAIPFLRPRDLVVSKAGQSGTEKQQDLQESIAAHYQTLYHLAVEKAKSLVENDKKIKEQEEASHSSLPIIMTGHLTTVGASTSDSVREIYIGTLDAFPADQFPPADYIALGHIHRSQKVAKTEHIRYSGSPIALSFDESQQQKSVFMVEFDGPGLNSVTAIDVPCFQQMASLKGDLASIEEQLNTLVISNDSGGVHQSDTIWLDIEIQSQEYLSDLQPRIESMCEGKPVEVLLIRRQKIINKGLSAIEEKQQLHELSTRDVFQRRLNQEEWLDDDSLAKKQRLELYFSQVEQELLDAE